MAEHTNHQPNIEEIRDLLSPYLDGEVTYEEQVLVEQALAASTELQQELESLRQTVSLVSALPPRSAPRPFMLSEADILATSPAPKRQFWLSGWVGGLALVATTVVCVLVAGGLFFGSRLSQNPLSEVARVEATGPAMQAVEAEADMAPAEPAAKASAEEPEEESVVGEASEGQDTERQKEVEAAAGSDIDGVDSAEKVEEQDFISPDNDDSASITGQAEVAENESAVERAPAQGAATEAPPTPTAQIVPAATTLPQATGTPTISAPSSETADGGTDAAGETSSAEQPAPALAAESTTGSDQQEIESVAGGEAPSTSPEKPPEGAQADEIASTDSSDAPAEIEAVAEAPSEDDESEEAAAESKEEAATLAETRPGDESQEGQDLTFRDGNTRAIKIREQRLQVQPGLIQIEGFIEADAGTPLLASLQRNQLPFDEWAAPVSLESVVQPDGRFSFNIQARVDRADQNLFALEAATYQITVSSVGIETPFIATIFFDTFRPDNSVQTSTAVPPTIPAIPLPTATADTVPPTVTPPAAADSPPQPLESSQAESQNQIINRWLVVGAGLLVLMVVLMVGVMIWVSLGKKR